MDTIAPTSLAEAEDKILATWRAGRPVYLGNRSIGVDAGTLSLAGLDRIEYLSVEDGVAVVDAGVSVQALREAATAKGLWCPPLRHLPSNALIGAVVAGGHGGRSRGYGGVADYLLGSRFLCPSVGLVRHGGTAIKNATGYNLTALLVGSRGCFGIILSLNLRLVPLPRESATRSYRVATSKAAGLAAMLAGTTPPFSPSRFDADSLLARLRPAEADAEILVEVSDASRAGLTARLERLDTTALRHGAQPTPDTDWSFTPLGQRLCLSLPPAEIPHRVTSLQHTLGGRYHELRWEATGGAIEIWANEFDPRLTALATPNEGSLQLREAFRRAFDPEGLLRMT